MTLTSRLPGVRKLRDTPVGVSIALVALLLIALMAIWPSLLASHDPLATDLDEIRSGPSPAHLLGTDRLGRDVYSRVIYGTRYSLLVGVSATALALALGALLGLAAGFGRRVWDLVISRGFDVLGAFPELLLALVLVAFMGTGMTNLIIAVGVAGAPRFGRVLRAEVLSIRSSEYVRQAVLNSHTRWYVAIRTVLPNALGPIPTLATLGVGTAILGASGLSFLGLGPKPPLPEWGSMLAESRGDLRTAWWTGVFPGVFITATVISITVVGRYLQYRAERREGHE